MLTFRGQLPRAVFRCLEARCEHLANYPYGCWGAYVDRLLAAASFDGPRGRRRSWFAGIAAVAAMAIAFVAPMPAATGAVVPPVCSAESSDGVSAAAMAKACGTRVE